ncbi:MAG: hypothetical protein JXL80_05765, partial [Planctomycetes bacterium]|nr:hypothetical protein [Planctomycetota bacterium]
DHDRTGERLSHRHERRPGKEFTERKLLGQWWERKANEYAEITVALHDLRRGIQSDINDITGESVAFGKEVRKEWNRRRTAAYDRVARAADTSMLFLCDKAQRALAAFAADWEAAGVAENEGPTMNDYMQALYKKQQAVEACLKKLSTIAKKELRIK